MTMLAARNRTGVLLVDGGSELWFADGRLYLAVTPKGSAITDVIFGAGVGSMEEVEQMFDEASLRGDVLDQILGAQPDREPVLQRLLHEHVLNSLFELLVPSRASFRFEPHRRHPLGDRCAQETDVLVAQAQQRLEIWRRIAARIPSTSAVLTPARTLPDGLPERLITADEWRYIALLDGNRTVAQVIAETGDSAFRVCSTLYRLLIEQLVVDPRDLIDPFASGPTLDLAATNDRR